MLRNLRVKNFRSLRSVSVDFSPTGLTVIAGANGTGKSNLIKCLEFLGSIPRDGLETTIRANNGVDAILPKALGIRQLTSTEVKFDYSVELPHLPGYPPSGPPIAVSHELSLQAVNTRRFVKRTEVLTFAEPLKVQASLSALTSQTDVEPSPESWLRIRSNLGEAIALEASPPMSGPHIGAYLEWLGFAFLKDTFEKLDANELSIALSQMFRHAAPNDARAEQGRGEVSSLLDPAGPALLFFSKHAGAFKEYMSVIRRFDLQLSQLRRQQDIASNKELAPDGRGLPAAVRNMKSRAGTRSNWQRLALTLSELAPHVSDTTISQLKSGQEFVQFIEAKTGRPVESWQSSDGTLRALAILLAVETHPERGTILIEEPEQGLHPWAVRTLITHLRSVITERGIQVILTTHSQQVLDSVDAGEILIASRTTKSGTQFQSIEEITGDNSIEKGEIGRMWVSGVLGGIPTYE
jgi:predicted ATPase